MLVLTNIKKRLMNDLKIYCSFLVLVMLVYALNQGSPTFFTRRTGYGLEKILRTGGGGGGGGVGWGL